MSAFQRFKRFIAELKRRKVFHVGSIYMITAWGASLGAAELFPAFGIPDWSVRAFVLTAALGLPLALIMAWAFEITPDGVVRDPGSGTPNVVSADSPTATATTRWAGDPGVRVRWESEGASKVADFDSDFTIGRGADANVQIKENKISRQHAQVNYSGGRWFIKDLGSRNGTLLNGERVSGAVELIGENTVVLFEGGPDIHISVQNLEEETQLA